MEQDNLEWVMRFQGDRCVMCNLGFQMRSQQLCQRKVFQLLLTLVQSALAA